MVATAHGFRMGRPVDFATKPSAQPSKVALRIRHRVIVQGLRGVFESPALAITWPLQRDVSASRLDRVRELLPAVEQCMMKLKMVVGLGLPTGALGVQPLLWASSGARHGGPHEAVDARVHVGGALQGEVEAALGGRGSWSAGQPSSCQSGKPHVP